MKKMKKNLVLIIVTVMLTLSCGNSSHSNMDNGVSENAKTDDYALLKDSGKPKKIIEDLSGETPLQE